MGVANFGAFLGGLTQGAESAENQRQKTAYLAMLQKKQKDADDDKSSTQEAQFNSDWLFASDPSLPPTTDPTQGARPAAPPQQAPAPQPGQPSMPMQGPGGPPPQMMQPGAQPMGPPQGPPPQGMPPGGPPPMQARPVPQPPPQQPPQQLPGVQGPQASAAPQQPPVTPQDGFARAQAKLDELDQQMKTPLAEKIMKDPSVQTATAKFHEYAKQLRDEGYSPGSGKKPDAVQMKTINLLHQQVELAMTTASKHATTDTTEQMKLGTEMAKVWTQQETLKQHMAQSDKQIAHADSRAAGHDAARGAGKGGGANDAPLTDEEEKDVAARAQYMSLNGGRPPPGMSAGIVNQRLNRAALARMGDVGDATSNKASITGKTQSLAANDKMLTKLRPAFEALDNNYAALLKDSAALKIPDNQPAAALQNYIRTKMGDTGYSNLNKWMYDVQNEMAQLAAAGSNVVAVQRVKDAQALIDHAQTAGQLREGYKQMLSAGKNIVEARVHESEKLKKEIAETGKKPAAGGGAASGGGTYKTADGKKSYTQDMINDAANAAGEDPAKFAKDRGLTRGD